jgi:hypothetical protein
MIGVWFPTGADIFLAITVSRPALVPIKLPIQWVGTGSPFAGANHLGCKAEYSPPSSTKMRCLSKNRGITIFTFTVKMLFSFGILWPLVQLFNNKTLFLYLSNTFMGIFNCLCLFHMHLMTCYIPSNEPQWAKPPSNRSLPSHWQMLPYTSTSIKLCHEQVSLYYRK